MKPFNRKWPFGAVLPLLLAAPGVFAADQQTDSAVHLAGYATVTYTDVQGASGNGSFGQVQFSPIFHYQYRDLVMLESELEIEATDDGETETKLEYLALDLFINDQLTVVAGKFLSPLGQFRQNMHPGWINKMASAPPGFGHDGAAPEAEVGAQVRGGIPIGSMRLNYSVYVGNGPELEAEGDEIEGIGTEGYTRDADNKKVIGGRIGFLPMPALEVGVSGAGGKAVVTKADAVIPDTEPARGYSAVGADINFQVGGVKLLGEYIRQKVDSDEASIAPEGGTWETWYAQASYVIPQTQWEGVIRYGDFKSPHASHSQKQTAVGVNYLFAPQLVGKLTYEINDGQADSEADRNRILAQIAYGF